MSLLKLGFELLPRHLIAAVAYEARKAPLELVFLRRGEMNLGVREAVPKLAEERQPLRRRQMKQLRS